MLEMNFVFRDLDLRRHESIRCAVRESLSRAIARDATELVDRELSDAKFRELHARAIGSREFSNEEEVRDDFIKKIEEELFFAELRELYSKSQKLPPTAAPRKRSASELVAIFLFFFALVVVVLCAVDRGDLYIRGGGPLDEEFAFMT